MSMESFLSYNATNKDADPLYLFDPISADLLWPITATQIPTVLVSGLVRLRAGVRRAVWAHRVRAQTTNLVL